MKKSLIIFSGYNPRALVAFIRTLNKNNVEYAIISSSPDDPIFATVYRDKVLAARSKKALDIQELLSCINKVKAKIKSTKYIIAPSTEFLNRFLLDNRKIFEENNCEIPLVNKGLYAQISDKYSFRSLCKKSGISVLLEYSDIKNIDPPFVSKPKKYIATDGSIYSPVLVLNSAEKDEFLKKNNAENFYYQKYLNGESLYLLYYFYKDGSVVKFSQQNLIQQADGKSMIAAKSSMLYTAKESLKYEKLFKSVGFYGLVMVEVKIDTDTYCMIEANPRFWGPSQLFVDAEVNLFDDFLFDNGVTKQKPFHSAPKDEARYFWEGGIQETLNEKKRLSYHCYSEQEYEEEKSKWAKADVYNRKDTEGLYIKEMSKL